MRLLSAIAICLLMLALTACSAAAGPQIRTDVAFKPYIPPAAPAFDLPANQKIRLGAPKAQNAPIYPPQWVGADLPRREVCVEVEIDERGEVHFRRALWTMPGCPAEAAAVESEFVQAAQQAVVTWHFAPALLCTFPAGTDASTQDDDCAAAGARLEPIAILLAFRFVYTQTKGIPKVRTLGLDAQ